MLNFQQDGWQEDPLFEFLAPRALILPFLCCLCDLCLALPLLAVPKEPNTGCIVFVFVSQYFVRGCICGRGGRVCALAVSPGWPLAPSGSLPHRHHYQRESWTGESPRSHPAPTPPRVHLPIVFWPWLTLHPPRIYFLAILLVSTPFSCSNSHFSVFSLPASPPGRLPRQP